MGHRMRRSHVEPRQQRRWPQTISARGRFPDVPAWYRCLGERSPQLVAKAQPTHSGLLAIPEASPDAVRAALGTMSLAPGSNDRL